MKKLLLLIAFATIIVACNTPTVIVDNTITKKAKIEKVERVYGQNLRYKIEAYTLHPYKMYNVYTNIRYNVGDSICITVNNR